MYQVDVYLRIRRAVMVDGMSIREVSRVFGLHRDTVRKILAYSAPPGYRRQTPPRRPKLEPFTAVIDQILVDDLKRPRKQRHTAQRIFQRLRDEHGFGGQYTIVKDYVSRCQGGARHIFAAGKGIGFGGPVRPTGSRRQGWFAAGGRRPGTGLLSFGWDSFCPFFDFRLLQRLSVGPISILLEDGCSTVGCSRLGLGRRTAVRSLAFSRIRWLI